VRDEHDAAARRGDEPAQPLQAVGVEVVGGLVEQDDVEARDAQGGEAGPRRLAAGEGAQRAIEQRRIQVELGGGCAQPRLGVGASKLEPAVQRRRVRLDRVERPGRQRRGQPVDLAAGAADADPLEDRRAYGGRPAARSAS